MVLKFGDHVFFFFFTTKMLIHDKLQIGKMTPYCLSMLDHLGYLSNIRPIQFNLKAK
jgi:hypothetical protein